MGQLIDADEVVAMLRQEAREWAAMADQATRRQWRIRLRAIAEGYEAAADDVEQMMKEQAAGNVPADGSK